MGLSLQDRVALLPEPERKAWIATQPPWIVEEMARGEWWWVSRPEQVPPPGPWFVCLALAGRGFGKALPLSTPVPTPSGWTELGQLRPGDEVFDKDGQPTKVTWRSSVLTDRQCYKITFHDGSSIVADADHQWVARSAADRRHERAWRTVTTAQMLSEGLRSSRGANWQMPVNGALDLPEIALPVAPYVLGYWLGDGDSASPTFTIGPRDQAEVLELLAEEGLLLLPTRYATMRFAPAALPPAREVGTGRMLPNGSLTSELKSLGVLGNKHIPQLYLRSGTTQRNALLQGLIDSDGYVNRKTGLVEITSVKRRLANDIVELVRSLGYRATLSCERAVLNGVDVGPKYRVTWVARRGGGRLDRKRLLDRSHLGQSERIISRYVHSIEPVASVSTCCIAVESSSETYLVTDRFLVTHNSRAGSEWVVNQVLRHPFDSRGTPTEWLVIAETLSDARTICMEGPAGILHVLERRKVKHRYKMSPRPMVLFPNGAKIYTEGADDPDVGRGYNASGAWLDEVGKWRTPRRSWYEGIMPSLRADLVSDHPRAFVTTTPKPIDIIQEWVKRDDGTIHVIRGSTFDNAANLSALVVEELKRRYEGTSVGRQELYGEIIEAFDGALFTRVDIEDNRIDLVPDDIVATVVGVDPSLTGEDDEMGIVVVARSRDNHLYVLADRSVMAVGRAAALETWRVAAEFGADKVVCETNLGKRWMQQVFNDAYYESVGLGLFPENTKPPLVGIDSKIGKRTRGEPVAMRSEQGRLHCVGRFPQLEDQMATFVGWGTRDSPDRLDALVHACRYLMEGEKKQARITSPREVLSSTLQSLWQESGSYTLGY